MRFMYPRKDGTTEWRPWFAWRPVRIGTGNGEKGPVVWLEHIERRDEIWNNWPLAYYREKPAATDSAPPLPRHKEPT